MKKALKIVAVIVLVVSAALLLSYQWVSWKSGSFLSADIEDVPKAKVAVLLGTSRYLSSGRQNLYFEYRMNAATDLFKNSKVDYILVSGDNSEESYNEPRAMYKALVERGVPADRIVMDYAGFRTLDSMLRAQKVFGQESFVVVSQKFHNERAVYIARSKGLEAFGFNARDVGIRGGLKTRLREVFARVKMLIDLYITQEGPRYLGEKIPIPAA